MLTPRTFPRYDISHYSFKLHGFRNKILRHSKPIMASLGGISFESTDEKEIQGLEKITVKYEDYKFKLTFKQVWFHVSEENTFQAGYALCFHNTDEYNKWFSFIKSLHELRISSKE